MARAQRPTQRTLLVNVTDDCFDAVHKSGRCPVEEALWRATGESFHLVELSLQTPDGDWIRLPSQVAEWAAVHARGGKVAPFSFSLPVPVFAWWLPREERLQKQREKPLARTTLAITPQVLDEMAREAEQLRRVQAEHRTQQARPKGGWF